MSEAILPKKIDGKWFTVLKEKGEEDVIMSTAVCELDANEKAHKENLENNLDVPDSVIKYLEEDKRKLKEYMAYRAKYP